MFEFDPLQRYVGKRYGRLTVVSEERDYRGNWFNCKCDCGNSIKTRKYSVLKGLTKSCGCLHREIAHNVNVQHGLSNTRLHRIWSHMRGRCYTPSDRKYKNYGGRGITVCPEWNDFVKFKEWAENNGYAENLTIERINVNGNYEPNNCTWVDLSSQTINKTTSHYFKHFGKIYSLKDLVDIFNLSYKYLHREIVTNKRLKDFNLERATYMDYINQ